MQDKLRALVVGGIDTGESNRVVYFLTERGREHVFARGAKSSRRRFLGALDVFTTIDAEVRSGKSEGMRVLVDATVVEARARIRDDLLATGAASCIVELARAVSPEGSAGPGVLRLAETALDRLNNATIASQDLPRMVWHAFQMRLVSALGYHPELSHCSRCERAPSHVDFSVGGALCDEHSAGAAAVGPWTLAWMHGVLAEGPWCERGGLDEATAVRASAKAGRALSLFFGNLVARPLKAEAVFAALVEVPGRTLG